MKVPQRVFNIVKVCPKDPSKYGLDFVLFESEGGTCRAVTIEGTYLVVCEWPDLDSENGKVVFALNREACQTILKTSKRSRASFGYSDYVEVEVVEVKEGYSKIMATFRTGESILLSTSNDYRIPDYKDVISTIDQEISNGEVGGLTFRLSSDRLLNLIKVLSETTGDYVLEISQAKKAVKLLSPGQNGLTATALLATLQ